MKFGVREICDVVLKAKAAQKVGNKIFYKNEPVIYFDTLKTSTMEGAASTVYATGGRGNARLIAWEGERTITFTMEDALISPAGFMILSGAGLIEASEERTLKVHTTEQTDQVKVETVGEYKYGEEGYTVSSVTIDLDYVPYTAEDGEDYVYVMLLDNGEVCTEPYIPATIDAENKKLTLNVRDDLSRFYNGCVVLVDYYTEKKAGAQQVDITPDKFGGNYYLEASTLFRDQNGVDMPAEFIIPNCKVQSNFTFSMASTGDPSTFTFTMDAFPDYTRFNKTKKVLAAIQIIETSTTNTDVKRDQTKSKRDFNDLGEIIDTAEAAE